MLGGIEILVKNEVIGQQRNTEVKESLNYFI